MRISDWSSDVCSSDLPEADGIGRSPGRRPGNHGEPAGQAPAGHVAAVRRRAGAVGAGSAVRRVPAQPGADPIGSASCRERGCQYGYISVDAVSLKKKRKKKDTQKYLTYINSTL